MTKEFICIVCPNSCRLTVSETEGKITVTGNECPRGEKHGVHEYREPTRMIATTVAIVGGSLPRLPVISVKEAPKALLGRCLEVLYGMKVRAPVRCGDIIVKNICDTGVDIAASRSINRKDG